MVGNAAAPPLAAMFVIDNLSSGGAQRQMANLAAGLVGRGHKVSFFTYAPGDLLAASVREAGCPIHFHRKTSRFSLSPIFALRRLLRSGAYDVVLAFLPTPSTYALLATLGMRPRVPVVVSERSSGLAIDAHIIRQATVQLYRTAQRVVVNSFHLRDHLQTRHAWMVAKLDVIYSGVDLRVFCPADGHASGPVGLKLLAVGSVGPDKNGLCLVEALRHLRDVYGVRPQVTWVGEQVRTIPERRAYLEKMQNAIAAHQLQDQWEWMPPREEIVALYRKHDALVHASVVEGLPSAVCESLACGLPVIVSDTLDHPRLVRHGVSGFLFDPRSPEALANAIGALSRLPRPAVVEMGRAARVFAEQHLSSKANTDAFEALLARLSCKHGRAA